MSKMIPEIHITNVEKSEDIQINSPDTCSGGLTDNEFLEDNQEEHSQRPFPKDFLLTDVEYSSDEEDRLSTELSKEFYQQLELGVGETLESVSNVHSPGKTQKSIVYSMKTPTKTQSDDFNTDWECISASEDDEDDILSFNFGQLKLSYPSNENTNIKDCLVRNKHYSPAVTPEPSSKKKLTPISAIQSFQTHTDSEYIYSDSDTTLKVKKGKGFFDGFASDMEDSDSSLSDNPFCRQRKTSLQMERLFVGASKNVRKRSEPTIIGKKIPNGLQILEKQKSNKIKCSMNIRKDKRVSSPRLKPEPKFHKMSSNAALKGNKCMQLVMEDKGSFTDVEEFEGAISDVEDQAVAYLPEAKREIVIANENRKGDVSLIFPISKPSNIKLMIGMETADCGFSDVEDLPDFIDEDVRICPTPEPPLTEASYIRSSESVKENSKLKIMIDSREPLTDTEEINFGKEGKYKKFLRINKASDEPLTDTEDLVLSPHTKKKIIKKGCSLNIPKSEQDPLTDTEEIILGKETYNKPKTKENLLKIEQVIDNLTDVEDLMEGDDFLSPNENQTNEQILTDFEEFSDDETVIERYPPTAYKDFEVISSCNSVTAKESHRPFSQEAKAKLNKIAIVPSITRISSSPIPCTTEHEDMSGDDEGLEQAIGSDDCCGVEPHMSTVHIRHTRMFQPRGDELKVTPLPDPLTDVEEIDVHHEKIN